MVTLSLQGLLKRRRAARQKASEERAAAREQRPSTAQAQQQHAQQKRSGASSRQQWKGPALSTLALSAGLSLLFASLICWTMIRYVPIAADFVFEQLKSVVDDQLGAQSSSKRKTVRNVMTAKNNVSFSELSDLLETRTPVVLRTNHPLCGNRVGQLFKSSAKLSLSVSTISTDGDRTTSLVSYTHTLESFRRRSTNPRAAAIGESEFVWSNQALGSSAVTELVQECKPELRAEPSSQEKSGAFDLFDAEIAISMALRGQGTNFMHERASFLNTVVEGEQHWIVFRLDKLPPEGIHGNESVTRWLSEYYSNVTTENTPWEAVLSIGDSLFVPEGHLFAFYSTSNVSTSVVKFRSEEPGEAQQMLSEGRRKLVKRDYKGAEKLLRKALTLDGGANYRVYELLGSALEASKDYDGAEDHYRRALFLNRRNSEVYAKLLSLQLARKNLVDAKLTIAGAMRNNALSSNLNKTMGLMLL